MTDGAATTERKSMPPVSGVAFAGAHRAVGYIEDPFTMHDEEREEVPASVGQVAAGVEEVESEPDVALPSPIQANSTEPAARVQSEASTHMVSKPKSSGMFGASFTELSVSTVGDAFPVASRGMRGVLSRFGIHMAPGPTEAAEFAAATAQRAAEQIIRQATWTRAVSVLVANPKGGTGKTPTSILLGGVLAAVRGGSVAIVEVSDDPGALTFRAEGNPPRGVGELVQNVTQVRTAGQLAGYTAPQTSFASVIGSTGRRERLTAGSVRAVVSVVDEFYSIRVMDSGNQPSSSAFQGAVETADALVVPVMNAGDAVLEAVALLEVLRTADGKAATLAANAIIIRLTDGRLEHPKVVEWVDQIIADAGISQVFTVPYDTHIAERGQLTLDSLALSTRQAFTAAAAGVVTYLQHSIH